jgi:hypothetical protein
MCCLADIFELVIDGSYDGSLSQQDFITHGLISTTPRTRLQRLHSELVFQFGLKKENENKTLPTPKSMIGYYTIYFITKH